MFPPCHVRRSPAAIAGWLSAALLLLTLPGQAQRTSASTEAADYERLVDRYASGDTEGAAEAIADRDAAWIESALDETERRARSWPARRIQSAMLLHTDAVVDGWALQNRVAANLAAARRLAGLAGDERLPPALRRDWLLVVNWYLLSELDLVAMPPWLDMALARFEGDLQVQVTLGSFFEALGWDESLPAGLPYESRVLRALAKPEPRQALEASAAAYRRALAIAPDSAQARVRLGRVLVQLRRPADATRTVAPVHDDSGDRVWPYLSWLVAGAAETERAAALLPSCQTPLVGLTAVRRLQGRMLESAELARVLATPGRPCDDPWSFYRFGELPDVRARLLLDLRRRVAAP
jgi:hypothetical protein